MRLLIAIAVVVTGTHSGLALDADEIMARMAANQERAEEARTAIVYESEVHTRISKSRKLQREERYVFTITPTPDRFESARDSFEGSLRHNGEMLPYTEPHFYRSGIDADAILSEVLLDFVNHEKTRDGFERDLFPLTKREQERFTFRLLGEDRIDGRETYRILFEPRQRSKAYKRDRSPWRGEVFVDKQEFQPVYITTDMARKVPMAVRAILGTNIKQVGFALQFREVEEGVWLPVSYGGEFKIKILFFYNRVATISLENRGFRRTDVESSIEFEEPQR